MKKSTSVTVGLVLLAGMSFACASEPDQEFMETNYDHHRICLDSQDVRVEDAYCPNEGENHSSAGPIYRTWYTGKGHAAPRVGSKAAVATGSGIRPTSGTVGTAPASGGFGTYTSVVGG